MGQSLNFSNCIREASDLMSGSEISCHNRGVSCYFSDHFGHLGVSAMIILKLMVKIWYVRVD